MLRAPSSRLFSVAKAGYHERQPRLTPAALRSVDFRGRAAIELAFEKNFVPKNPLAEDWKLSLDYVRKIFGW